MNTLHTDIWSREPKSILCDTSYFWAWFIEEDYAPFWNVVVYSCTWDARGCVENLEPLSLTLLHPRYICPCQTFERSPAMSALFSFWYHSWNWRNATVPVPRTSISLNTSSHAASLLSRFSPKWSLLCLNCARETTSDGPEMTKKLLNECVAATHLSNRIRKSS